MKNRVDSTLELKPKRVSFSTCLIASTALLLVLGSGTVLWLADGDAPATDGKIHQLDEHTISFGAIVNAQGFTDHPDLAGYHALVWRGGKASDAALLQAEVTDVQVLDALEALGAEPGNALESSSWDHRHDADDPAPRRHVAGPLVEALVRLAAGQEPIPLAELLEDPGGRGLALRFGGHRALIPEWRSGCVICLYSCPGSKIGNAAYTVRDYVDGTTRFTAKPGVLPADGTRVEVMLRLL